VKKDRFRVLALGKPNLDKLPSAIQKGIWQCIALFTEAPPKGGRDNFGFAAYEKFANMLTNTRNKQSWERLLPPGRRMYAALAGFGYQPGAFGWARTYPSNQVHDRRLYAEFLEQGAEILNKPALRPAAELFRTSSEAWRQFSDALLPEDVPLLKETRNLLLRKHELFVQQGQDALEEIQGVDMRLGEIRARVADEFPMGPEAVARMREGLAEQIMGISQIERGAIDSLQAAMT
jgi:hypothetical protein